MIENQVPGCIINISSISKSGNAGQTNYSAAKAGVSAMATVWAKRASKIWHPVCSNSAGVYSHGDGRRHET